MSETASLANLPLDILVLIFPYLDARSFLSLCSTCKPLYQEHIRLDPSYWSYATRSTFRVPNRPVVQSDGQRWHRLYKRLLTQSRVYTWGSNTNGCLGHSYDEAAQPPQHARGQALRMRGAHLRPRGRGLRPSRVPQGYFLKQNVARPKEMENAKDVGIVADLQCGGWSTTILSSRGVLHTVGVLDGERRWGTDPILSPLQYPAGFPEPGERDEPAVAIRQFSSSRKNILGLADSGRIWSWYNEKRPGLHVKFLHHETVERTTASGRSTGRGQVKKVVAGWNKSSALIGGVGIVVWEELDGSHGPDLELDAVLIADTAVVPDTHYARPRKTAREHDTSSNRLSETVGEVVNYIVLESYVIFVTDLCRLFCSKIYTDEDTLSTPRCLELGILQRTSEDDSTPRVTDVHGSFRSFAILKSTGEVLTATQDYLDACWTHVFDATIPGSLDELPYTAYDSPLAAARAPLDGPEGLRGLRKYPALQNAGVIAMAFGDYHFHALHSNGSITSYGREPKACGTLGLGSSSTDTGGTGEGDIRGIKYLGFTRDGELVQQAYTTGREIWFQPEKSTWLQFLANGGHDPEEARERMAMWRQDQQIQGQVSDWVERRGRDWDKSEALQQPGDDGLGAHFALSVAAAGWHSGALVLVNEGLADAVAKSCVVEDAEYGQDAGEEPLGPEPQVENPPVSVPENDETGQHTNNPDSALAYPSSSEQQSSPPINSLASPGKGWRYTWAYDGFPSL